MIIQALPETVHSASETSIGLQESNIQLSKTASMPPEPTFWPVGYSVLFLQSLSSNSPPHDQWQALLNSTQAPAPEIAPHSQCQPACTSSTYRPETARRLESPHSERPLDRSHASSACRRLHPGITALHLIPSRAQPHAVLRVRPRRTCLLAVYATPATEPRTVAVEQVLTIAPFGSCLRSSGRQRWMSFIGS